MTSKRYKAMFIVSSTAQAEMFKSIAKKLHNWDIIAINSDRAIKRKEIESILTQLDFSHKTISRSNPSAVRETLEREMPDIIIVGHDRNPMDRLFIKIANSRGTPTLLVQDGILAASREKNNEFSSFRTDIKYYFTLPLRALRFIVNNTFSWSQKIELGIFELRYGTKGKNGIYGHGDCQKMAIFGNAVREMLISEGIDPSRLMVTGNPKFDQVYYSKSNNCKARVCEKWNIPEDMEIVLLLTQYMVEAKVWSKEQRRDFVLAIAKAVADLPNAQLIIKLHPPQENEEDYHRIVDNLSSRPIICKYEPLHELLSACSLAITVSSTAALEAMAIGKPVVIVSLFGDRDGASIYKGCGALFVEHEKDILPALQKALYDPQSRAKMMQSMERFVYQQAYLQDGRASERIADLIRNMVACK